MAERKPGPVKPPVIEGVARPATARPDPAPEAAKPEVTPEPAKPEAAPKPEVKAEVARPAPKPEPPKPEAPKTEAPKAPPQTSIGRPSGPPPPFSRRPPEPEASWPLLGGVAVGGAVLGTILTYLLGNIIALPTRGPSFADPGPELVSQGERLDALEQRLGAIEGTSSKTQQSLDATIVQLDTGLADLRKSIDDVRAAIPAPVTVDLSGIEAELKTLKGRLDALAAGVTGSDADAIGQSLAALDANIASLANRLDGVDSSTAALRTDVDAARKLLTDHIAAALPTEMGPALKLPLILSGLETAFDSGKPFAVELEALATIVPDIVVPERLATSAANGIVRPDALARKFESLMPEILAARSASKGNWAADALDWLKALLALRPSAETDGDTPEAIASRLEGAMDRQDYQAAANLLAQLPAEMRNASGTLGADIATHADADVLLADLRARALTGAGTPQ